MATVTTVKEGKRGCGYRKPGGMYFRSNGVGSICCKLPFILEVCSCCGQGVKPARGYTWINSKIFATESCISSRTLPTSSEGLKKASDEIMKIASACPMNLPDTRMGLIWIGGSHYPTYQKFMEESAKMGVSRRIAQIPRDFKMGETWIALAHREAIEDGLDEKGKKKFKPAIFSMFKPDRIEYVVKGTETEEELTKLEKRGLTLIKVVHDIDKSFEELPNVD